MAARINPRERFILLLYFLLLSLCLVGIFASNLLLPTGQEVVLSYASDGFKVTLGALLGSMSVMLGGQK